MVRGFQPDGAFTLRLRLVSARGEQGRRWLFTLLRPTPSIPPAPPGLLHPAAPGTFLSFGHGKLPPLDDRGGCLTEYGCGRSWFGHGLVMAGVC
jgi:hypothetical protein